MIMKSFKQLFSVSAIFILILSSCTNKQPQEWIDPLNETKEQRDSRMEWWRDARFGLFIHWGVYAVPAGTYKGEKIPGIGEWIMQRAKIPVSEYKEFAKDFNPVNYDPKAWVKMAKDAGMKYIVITSKHHDGFALFDSKVTDWDVVDASPYGKDLLKPLVKEAKKAGLKIGFYYSQAQDWNHPGGAKAGYQEGEYWDEAQGGSFDEYLKNIAYPQVEEIFSNYDIDILWWDTPTWMTKERAELLRPLLAMKPGLITNNRLGGGYKGDSDTPEQHIPATGIEDRDWEVCMTMNETWGYKSYDDNWKSTEDLVHKLIDIASKGGNFLLNVGPKPDGTIPQESIDRLAGVGEWMNLYSESIYETQPSPFRRPWWGRCTRKELENGNTRLYLHVFDWPKDNILHVPVNNEVVACYSMADSENSFDALLKDGVIDVQLKGTAPNEIASVIVLDIEGTPDVTNQVILQDDDGSLTLMPEDSDLENRSYLTTDHAKLIREDDLSYITWKSTRTWMEWPVDISKAVYCDVEATFASSGPGNKLLIQIGDETSEFDLPDTGGLDQFQTLSLGKLDLPAGTYKISVKGISDDWKEYYFSKIYLRPGSEIAKQRMIVK
jgi:alpha-L-fucosidase